MTHDELLAKMKELSRTFAYEPNLNFESALRAVVELHKPEPLDERGDVCLTCCPDLLTLYPCPTIEAIQEQLK
jgi:uncharacterized protein with PIN domain